MKRFLVTGILSVSFVAVSYFLAHDSLCKGFLPENNLKIPVSFTNTGITEQEFTSVMNRYESVYKPIVAAEGGTLVLNRLWTDATVNANATRFWNQWYINMYGGLARYPGMTADGMMLVVCHETGHHIGRQPYMGPLRWGWATNEGGADYFSALKCARKVFAADDNEKIVSALGVAPEIMAQCNANFANLKEAMLCARSAHAGTILAKVLSSLSKDSTPPQVTTPDKNVVADIYDAHPAAQCRLDTYYQASICQVSANAELDIRDYHINSCVGPKFKLGLRPNCWFKPDASDAAAKLTISAND